MKEDEAKQALDTIKILQASQPDKDTDALCVTIIERLMKRTVADYKQYMKDQQENKKEYWVMIYNGGKDISTSFDNYKTASRHLKELKQDSLGSWNEAYVTKVTEVMDNE